MVVIIQIIINSKNLTNAWGAFSMNMKFLISIILISFIPHTLAQVYKTTDENGKVTFSNIKPTVSNESATQVEKLDVDLSNEAMTTVSTEFGEKFCGDIKLPSMSKGSYSSKYFVKNVMQSKRNWQNSLKRLNERIAYNTRKNVKTAKNNYYNSTRRNQLNSSQRKQSESNVKRLRDLRCAINWSKSQNGTINELQTTINNKQAQNQSESSRLEAIKSKLESSIRAQCGSEPIYDPTLKSNESQRRRWSTCSRKNRNEIKKIDRKLRRLRY